jgi:small subunit ribosomal protein S3
LGRKVHPIGFRLGYIKDWESRWFAEGKQYAELLTEDVKIRNLVHQQLGRAGISRIEIQRFPKQIAVTIVTARPGIVIGRKGSNVNALKSQLEGLTDVTGKNLRLDVVEVERPELDAHLVSESIAEQLERRVSQKRAMRQSVTRAMRAGAKGIKIVCSGRLAGSEMARREWMREGRVPLQSLRADIDYAVSEALTTFGRIGVKVWIYRGEVLPEAAEASGNA